MDQLTQNEIILVMSSCFAYPQIKHHLLRSVCPLIASLFKVEQQEEHSWSGGPKHWAQGGDSMQNSFFRKDFCIAPLQTLQLISGIARICRTMFMRTLFHTSMGQLFPIRKSANLSSWDMASAGQQTRSICWGQIVDWSRLYFVQKQMSRLNGSWNQIVDLNTIPDERL